MNSIDNVNGVFVATLGAAGGGPLNCSYLVRNNGTGNGLTFSSADVMVGVSIKIFDLSNSSMCNGPFPIEGAPPCPIVPVGEMRTTQGTEVKHIRTPSNVVMVEATFSGSKMYSPGDVFKTSVIDYECASDLTDECVQKYTHAYGCKSTRFALPIDDPCYKTITYDGCAETHCTDICPGVCDYAQGQLQSVAQANLSAIDGWSMCRATCNTTTTEAATLNFMSVGAMFCAPGCVWQQIGDGMCSPECFNDACYNDGGDCSGADPNSMYAPMRVVSLMGALDQNPDLPESIDGIMDSVEGMNEFALGMAGMLVRPYDANLDGHVSPEEVAMVNPSADEQVYDMFLRGGLYDKDASDHLGDFKGSADLLANILFGVYVSLSGRTLTEPAFDNRAATMIIMTMLDRDEDDMLSFSEISRAGISPSMAMSIDTNEDTLIGHEELLGAQMRMMESGCAGTTLISNRHEVITTKPPLTGSLARRCDFLILPNWFYPSIGDGATGSSVMARRSGGVPAKAARASQKDQKMVRHRTKVPAAHAAASLRRSARRNSDASPLENGEPVVDLVDQGMGFVVKVMADGQFLCMGAMIKFDVVIVSGSCGDEIRQSATSETGFVSYEPIQVYDANNIPLPLTVISMRSSPNGAVGANGFALIQVHDEGPNRRTVSIPETVELHDGGGLDLSDCREKMVAVGLAMDIQMPIQNEQTTTTPAPERRNAYFGGTASPFPDEGGPDGSVMAQQSIDVYDKTNCEHEHGLAHRVNPVLDRHACGVAFPGAWKACFAPGHLLLARHPEDNTKWILVGIADKAASCDSPLNRLPTLFNEVASELPWILSNYDLGRFPPLMLAVTASDLSIGDGDEVHVRSGGMEMGNISSKCELGGEYYDLEGVGSLNVSISTIPGRGQEDANIKLTVGVKDCGSLPGNTPQDCEVIKGCMAMPGSGGECISESMCEFSPDWKSVTKNLQSKGKAFTGGLGGETEVNGMVEYRQWMCARDWDVEEQLACGLGPAEIGCFRFDEKAVSGSGFIWYGRNAERKIVSDAKMREGVAKQRRGLITI